MQGDSVAVLDAMAGAQKSGVVVDQGLRQQAFLQHFLITVHIRQNLVHQGGALDHRCFDARPFVLRQDQRQHIQIPGALHALGVGVDVVGHAVFPYFTLHHFDALTHGFR